MTSIDVTARMLSYAAELARESDARAILVYADVFGDPETLQHFLESSRDVPILLVSRQGEHETPCAGNEGKVCRIRVPDVFLTRIEQIKIAVLLGIARGILTPGNRLVCLSGIAGKGRLDTMMFTEVSEEFEMFAGGGTSEFLGNVQPEVFQRVLDIAVSLGNEGREGKPVGATFVVGDTDAVMRYVKQMILNPFRGYPESDRNILDANIEETVKEFAAIDGAFIIRGDGVIESAGAYLAASVSDDSLPYGLGARHNSAAGITEATDAIAITVSSSTGNVTVFRNGKIVAEIERPRLPMLTVEQETARLRSRAAGQEAGSDEG